MSIKTKTCCTQCICDESSSSRSFNYDKSKICNILLGTDQSINQSINNRNFINNYCNEEKNVIYSGINRPMKVFKHVRGCYLNEPAVKPFLRLNHDGKCQKRMVKTNLHGVKKLPKTSSMETSKNVQTQTTENHTTQTQRTQTERKENYLDLDFTERREDYERSKSSVNTSKFISSQDSSSTTKDFNQFKQFSNNTHSSLSSEFSLRDKLKEIEDFRKDNYFDTHLTNTSLIPDHKCVHQFKINNRFLPEPINPDVYGISRCTICNKALESPTKKFESKNEIKSGYLKKNRNKKDVQNVKKRYEMKLKPVSVNIGTGKEVMKISVPYKMEEECFWGRNLKKIGLKSLPFDSLALRHQKGVLV